MAAIYFETPHLASAQLANNIGGNMIEGLMYQVIDGKAVEVIRWGEKLLPLSNPLTKEVVGQLVLKLEGIHEETI